MYNEKKIKYDKILFLFSFLFFFTYGNWYTTTLCERRAGLAATSVNNLALFAGGFNNGELSSKVDIYDSKTNLWYTATLSEGRYEMAATTVGNLALFSGGWGLMNGWSSQVDIYNYSSNSWSTTTLSIPRSNLAATTVGNLAIFAGGLELFDNYFGSSSQVDIYNYNTNAWYTATLSEARSGLVATTVNNLALFAGGFNNSIPYSSQVDIYDLKTDTWYTATLSEARSNLVATTVNNLALFAGGLLCSSNNYIYCLFSKRIDIYNSKTNSWYTATFSEGRYNLVATTVNNLALFAGGISDIFDKPSSFSNQVDIYDSISDVWYTATLSEARSDLVATTVNNIALFAGGYYFKGGENNGTVYYSSQIDIFKNENFIKFNKNHLF